MMNKACIYRRQCPSPPQPSSWAQRGMGSSCRDPSRGQEKITMRAGGAINASLKNRLKANCMDRKAWEVNGLKPYPWTIRAKPLRKIGQFF